MTRSRSVVGAVDDDDTVLAVARAFRDEGREVVFVGGGQTPEQLISTALAEDADELVVVGEFDQTALERARTQLDAEHVRITPAAGVTDPTRREPV